MSTETFQFVGVDISKATFDVAAKKKGKVLTKVFQNTERGFESFTNWLKRHVSDAWVCMEATGRYGEGLAEYLCAQEIPVTVENAYKIKNFGKARMRRNKTDKVDAKLIMEYAYSMPDGLRQYQARTPAEKSLRDLYQLRSQVQRQLNQLRLMLPGMDARSAPQCQKEIDFKKNHMKELEADIRAVIKEDEALNAQMELLLSIDGIGFITACAFLTFTPDIDQFANVRQFCAFVGVNPSICESGTWKGKSRLSRYGNNSLKENCYMAGLSVMRRPKALEGFIARLQSRNKNGKQIVCAVMRKLTCIVFGVLKSGMPYDPSLVVARS